MAVSKSYCGAEMMCFREHVSNQEHTEISIKEMANISIIMFPKLAP